jgi:hypothetical protein
MKGVPFRGGEKRFTMKDVDTLNKAWKEWGIMFHPYNFRFGQYFINNFTKDYKNPDIYYETDPNAAYTELLWEIASGQLDGKLVDNDNRSHYTTQTNQKGGV